MTTITETNAKAAHTVELEIKELLGAMRTAWVFIAEKLYHFNDQKMWEPLGYDTFEEWLASPEIELSRRHVYNLIEIWRETVVKRGLTAEELAGLEMSKVKEVLPAVRKGLIGLPEALSDVRALSRRDLRKRYKGGVIVDDEDVHLIQCPTCGSWIEKAAP